MAEAELGWGGWKGSWILPIIVLYCIHIVSSRYADGATLLISLP